MKKIIAILLTVTFVLVCMSLTASASRGAYDSGYVFYYQHFDKNVDINATGLTKADNVDANFMMAIDSYTGYLSTHSIAAPDYQKFILPDILPYEVTTFSVEVRFCFTDPATYRQGGLVVGFGEGGTRTDCNLRYNLNGQFDKFGTLSNASQWVMGEWVNMKVMIKDGIFYQATVQVDGKEAVTLTSTTNTPANPGKIFFMVNRAGIDFEYIRVVAGIDYTSYSGEYANTSYSGNQAPAETTAADTTTATPPETTVAHVETTTAAVETTTAPVETTAEAVETTEVPQETTTVSADTTTAAPAVTTDMPASTGGCGGSVTAIVGVIAIVGMAVIKKKQN